MRFGPLDPKTKSFKVGAEQMAQTDEGKTHFDQTVYRKKERTGFSGGFKIPEEVITKKLSQKKRTVDGEQKHYDEDQDQSLVTKEEVLAHLNLVSADNISSGKFGAGQGKAGITKELIEGLEKDLKKLRLQEDNFKNRLHFQKTGEILKEETAE